jgi:hypothetical protein
MLEQFALMVYAKPKPQEIHPGTALWTSIAARMASALMVNATTHALMLPTAALTRSAIQTVNAKMTLIRALIVLQTVIVSMPMTSALMAPVMTSATLLHHALMPMTDALKASAYQMILQGHSATTTGNALVVQNASKVSAEFHALTAQIALHAQATRSAESAVTASIPTTSPLNVTSVLSVT